MDALGHAPGKAGADLAAQRSGAGHRLDGPTARRILIVDDSEIVRTGLRFVLGRQAWVSRCIGAADASAASSAMRRHVPHIALIDVMLADASGIEFCLSLTNADPRLKVILMSDATRVCKVVARAAGAHGFVSKHWSSDAIVDVVSEVNAGRTWFPPSERANLGRVLSRRELDVLRHLANGLSNREAATFLNVSPHTVKQYTCSLYRKPQVRNRAEAASRAQELGLV